MTVARRTVALVALVALGACAETTVDTTRATVEVDGSVPPTSTTEPTGTTAELLDRLIDETTALSERVVEDDGETEALARIEALWVAVEPDIEAERPDLLDEFDGAMDYARRAVERRRPADADKASRNLRSLVANL
ncbi:MAG: hypothetical protein ACK5OX_06610 [Desertimonas sp.]